MSDMPKVPKVSKEEFQVLIDAVRALARSMQVVNQFGIETDGPGTHQKDGEPSWQRAIEILDQLTPDEDHPAESTKPTS
jgi:hypothetical protein